MDEDYSYLTHSPTLDPDEIQGLSRRNRETETQKLLMKPLSNKARSHIRMMWLLLFLSGPTILSALLILDWLDKLR